MTRKSQSRRVLLVAVALLAALSLIGATTPVYPSVTVVYAAEVSGPDALAPFVLSYQGRLADPLTGAAKPDGIYQMTFALYEVASGGSILWSESRDIQVKGGLFSALLGEIASLPTAIFDGRALWLGVTVGGDPQASPRLPLSFVAYAAYATSAGNAGSAATAGDAQRLGGQPASSYATATHTHDASAITTGTLAYDRFNAYGDLANDGRVGVGANQVAPGIHEHKGTDIVDGSIGTVDLADGSVTSAKIADGGVALVDLAANSVDGTKIVDGSVGTSDLANSSVTSAKIADGTIATADLADASVTSAKIADGAVALADLAANSVDGSKIVDGSIRDADIQDRTRKIGFPANALNHNTGGLISQYYSSGLRWVSNYTESAGLVIPRPTDWDGSTDVTMRVWFYPMTSTAGYVNWFIRPRAWNAGSSVGDASSVSGTMVYVNQANVLKEQLFTIPASALNRGILWYITLQRYGTGETYREDVILMAVELSYNAVR